jgi:hypothetical protein
MNRGVRAFGGKLSSFVTSALALAVVALGGAGCDTYHYYDMDLQFDTSPGKFTTATVGEAQYCRIVVSGADSHEIDLDNCALNSDNSNTMDVGTFEFATFADSGTLTFTVDAYTAITPTPQCLYGTGTTSIQASSTVTQKGTLVIEPDGTGCPNNPGN